MRKVRSFFGGIYPEDVKQTTAGTPIQALSAPETVVVPLLQHVGLEAKPVVAKGDEVLKGQLLAEAEGATGAPVHSPVSGKVLAIEPRPHQSGHSVTAIVIENDGQDNWVERTTHPDPVQLDAEEILKRISQAGVVGMGGAGFPTAAKLTLPKGITLDYLIINGCECEPHYTTDHRLMVEYPEDIVLGAKLMAKASGARQIVMRSRTTSPMPASLKEHAGSIEIVAVPTRYPAGEKALIQQITKRGSQRRLALPSGAVVQNVATARRGFGCTDGEP